MSRRGSFLLRTDPRVVEALKRWAADEMRSANGQLDFVLRRALRQAGRWPPQTEPADEANGDPGTESGSEP